MLVASLHGAPGPRGYSGGFGRRAACRHGTRVAVLPVQALLSSGRAGAWPKLCRLPALRVRRPGEASARAAVRAASVVVARLGIYDRCERRGDMLRHLLVAVAAAGLSATTAAGENYYNGWVPEDPSCATDSFTDMVITPLGTLDFNTGDSYTCMAWKMAATFCATEPMVVNTLSGGDFYCNTTACDEQYFCTTCDGLCHAGCDGYAKVTTLGCNISEQDAFTLSTERSLTLGGSGPTAAPSPNQGTGSQQNSPGMSTPTANPVSAPTAAPGTSAPTAAPDMGPTAAPGTSAPTAAPDMGPTAAPGMENRTGNSSDVSQAASQLSPPLLLSPPPAFSSPPPDASPAMDSPPAAVPSPVPSASPTLDSPPPPAVPSPVPSASPTLDSPPPPAVPSPVPTASPTLDSPHLYLHHYSNYYLLNQFYPCMNHYQYEYYQTGYYYPK